MNVPAFLFLSCLSCGFLVGCATAPTPQQQSMIDSGVRIATMAYILKSGDAAGQQARAVQALATTAQIRAQIDASGKVVPNLDALAEWANQQIMANTKMTPEDKRLLQAAMLEAIFLSQDMGLVAADIGAANAARVLAGLDQVDRVARALAGA